MSSDSFLLFRAVSLALMVLNYSHWVMLGSGTGVGKQEMTIAPTSSRQLSDHRKSHVANGSTTTTTPPWSFFKVLTISQCKKVECTKSSDYKAFMNIQYFIIETGRIISLVFHYLIDKNKKDVFSYQFLVSLLSCNCK